METRTNKNITRKLPGFFRRAFKPVADVAAQSLVDAEIQRMAKRHQAVSLFAPTFKSWNR
ncbi:MAG: hypothetical protein WCH43_11545 [Verrucomicrobiota bacterium]